jgi:hypothetical protein
MTATRPAHDDAWPAHPEIPGGELAVMTAAASHDVVDNVEAETRHRLRRALRILLAARRRDDGALRHTDT